MMPKGTHLTEHEQGQISAFHSSGMTVTQISNKLRRSRCAIYTYLKDPGRYGKAKRTGRPKKVSAQMQRLIINKLKSSSKTIGEVQKQLDLKVSRATIGRVIKKSSQFVYKRKTTAPALTYSHKVNRLKWVLFHNRFQPHEWDCVIFSDEKKFNGDGPDAFSYYWHTVFKEDEVFSKRQNGGVSVIIWGCFSLRGKAPLVFLDEKQDSGKYTTMFERHMVPWTDTVHPNNWISQQDNALIHASRHSIKWFTKKAIFLLEWPARSPDLNPIENL